MPSSLYPLLVTPVAVEKPWGQTRHPLAVYGFSPEARLGEVWLTADGPVNSLVSNGRLAGMTLSGVNQLWSEKFLGTSLSAFARRPFPILLKFLHASEYLSVQVHPDDHMARLLEGGGPGKNEAWYILDAEPSAELVMDLKPGLGQTDLSQALNRREFAALLGRIPAQPGQVHVIHAGRIHAIGPGVTLFEIQQNSDVTYRFFDWYRLGDDGRPRPLHLEKAMQSLDPTPLSPSPFMGLAYEKDGMEITCLVAVKSFCLEKWRVRPNYAGRTNEACFEIITVLSGQGRLVPEASPEVVPLSPGATAVLPAFLGEYHLESPEGLTLLHSWIPNRSRYVIGPLREAGFTSDEIEQLGGPRRPNDLSPLLTA